MEAIPRKMDIIWQKVIRALDLLVTTWGGICIKHPDIFHKNNALFQPNGEDLSKQDQDIWLGDI